MKFASIMIVVCSLLLACAASHKTTIEDATTPHFSVANNTQLFLSEYRNEKDLSHKMNKPFTPSQGLVDRYELQMINNDYCLFGFIKVDTSFSETKLNKIGVKTNSRSGKIITVQIPLKSLSSFLHLSSITYFEISHKMNLNK